jgi:ribosomal protein S1
VRQQRRLPLRFESEVVSGLWRGANKRLPIGSVHNCPVTNTASFGVFVEIEPGVDGLIHSSKLPVDFKTNEAFRRGEMVHVSILSVDRVERRVELDWIRSKATKEGFRDRSAQH